MSILNALSPEERAEYDDLMLAASRDDKGQPVPLDHISARVVALLHEAADQAGRSWAVLVRDDMYRIGAWDVWRRWNARRPVAQRSQGGDA